MIKDIVRAIVPKSFREARYERLLSFQFEALRKEWLSLSGDLSAVERSSGFDHFLIFPGDPGELLGSVGDEAMITACIQTARSINPNVQIYVLVEGEHASRSARSLGLEPVDIWGHTADFLQNFAEVLRLKRIDATIAVGADIIDGVYGIVVPARMIYAADIAVRMGVSATVLGSSFNKRPRAELAQVFDDADPRISFLLRDKPSFERFSHFTKAKGVLVTDSAFMLQGATPNSKTAEWLAVRRAQGKTILGFNIHPMLVKEDPLRVSALADAAVSALPRVMQDRNVAFVLIPHDRRADVGDMVILGRVYERLKDTVGHDLLMIDANALSAAELKGTAGALDGVVTGRMHLAIGALGKGVPVLCVSYQDKFEGLFDHFELPPSMLMEVPEASAADVLVTRLNGFLNELSTLRAKVNKALPRVLEKSRRNFSGLDSAAVVNHNYDSAFNPEVPLL
jgi:polysaccharide pyruvyl transferase WcaK-like protein